MSVVVDRTRFVLVVAKFTFFCTAVRRIRVALEAVP